MWIPSTQTVVKATTSLVHQAGMRAHLHLGPPLFDRVGETPNCNFALSFAHKKPIKGGIEDALETIKGLFAKKGKRKKGTRVWILHLKAIVPHGKAIVMWVSQFGDLPPSASDV